MVETGFPAIRLCHFLPYTSPDGGIRVFSHRHIPCFRVLCKHPVSGSGVAGILLHASSNAVSLALLPEMLPAPTPDQMTLSGLVLLGLQLLIALLVLISTRGRLSYSLGHRPGARAIPEGEFH